MKLLLTSTGLTNQKIKNKFLELVNKTPSKIKIIFLPTASRSKEELKYVQASKQELIDLGIPEQNIKTISLDKKLDEKIEYNEIMNFDVIYVCGGNTFYLLKKVRESGFDRIITKFIDSGKLYFGVSAGSILVCPDIDIATPFDENEFGIKDLTGLNLTDVIVTPHYCEKEKLIIDKFQKKTKTKVIRITDNQALMVIDEKKEIIE